jgi:hypothetical protein
MSVGAVVSWFHGTFRSCVDIYHTAYMFAGAVVSFVYENCMSCVEMFHPAFKFAGAVLSCLCGKLHELC